MLNDKSEQTVYFNVFFFQSFLCYSQDICWDIYIHIKTIRNGYCDSGIENVHFPFEWAWIWHTFVK